MGQGSPARGDLRRFCRYSNHDGEVGKPPLPAVRRPSSYSQLWRFLAFSASPRALDARDARAFLSSGGRASQHVRTAVRCFSKPERCNRPTAWSSASMTDRLNLSARRRTSPATLSLIGDNRYANVSGQRKLQRVWEEISNRTSNDARGDDCDCSHGVPW
jgi:hypothetical protein